ncbi:MAG: hypothetical protein AAF529_20015 [Pseudomonadota bacterium]
MTDPEQLLDPDIQRWFAEADELSQQASPDAEFACRSQQMRQRSKRQRRFVYWLLTVFSGGIALLASEPLLVISQALMQPLLPVQQPLIALLVQPLNCVGGLLVAVLFGLRWLLRTAR